MMMERPKPSSSVTSVATCVVSVIEYCTTRGPGPTIRDRYGALAYEHGEYEEVLRWVEVSDVCGCVE